MPKEEDDDSWKYEDYLEQGVQGTFKVLDKDDVTALRKNFERLMGGATPRVSPANSRAVVRVESSAYCKTLSLCRFRDLRSF